MEKTHLVLTWTEAAELKNLIGNLQEIEDMESPTFTNIELKFKGSLKGGVGTTNNKVYIDIEGE